MHRSAKDGFTLIELLVAMLLVGALAAITLPGFTNAFTRARESKANVHLSAINRMQQSYRLENSSFADSLSTLGLAESDSDYTYEVEIAATSHVIIEAEPKSDRLRGYKGVAYVLEGGIGAAICAGTRGQVPSDCEADEIIQAIAYASTLTASAPGSGFGEVPANSIADTTPTAATESSSLSGSVPTGGSTGSSSAGPTGTGSTVNNPDSNSNPIGSNAGETTNSSTAGDSTTAGTTTGPTSNATNGNLATAEAGAGSSPASHSSPDDNTGGPGPGDNPSTTSSTNRDNGGGTSTTIPVGYGSSEACDPSNVAVDPPAGPAPPEATAPAEGPNCPETTDANATPPGAEHAGGSNGSGPDSSN